VRKQKVLLQILFCNYFCFVARIPVASGRSRDHLARIGSATAQRHGHDHAAATGHVPRSQVLGLDGTDLGHSATVATDPRRLRDPSSRTDRRKYAVPSSSRV